ncbi:MAG: hypothetical protein IT365_11505 [Candidatus Hydrogenedentes bacterium]|nr:hypothetical protein [Candidatus Hydrogenedentota bacterium]
MSRVSEYAARRARTMASASTTVELSRLFEKIYETRRRIWLLTAARAAAGASCLWLASLLLLGGFSLLYPFPVIIRIILLALHAIAMALGAWLGLRYAFTERVFSRGRRLRAWALHCEEMFPAMGNRLVTCVDLTEQADGQSVFESNPVAQALLRDTAARFRPFDPVRAVPTHQFGAAISLAVLPLVILAALFVSHGSWMGRAMTGLYAYRTEVVPTAPDSVASQIMGLTVQPGTIEVPRGSSVTIETLVESKQPVQLNEPPAAHVIRDAASASQPDTHAMLSSKDTAGAYFFAMHDIAQPTGYQVSLTVREEKDTRGDKLPVWLASLFAKASGPQVHEWHSPVYAITPYDPPEIESIQTTLTYPAYAGLPEEIVEGPFIKGLTGSTATIRVRSNHPIHEAELVEEEGQQFDAQIADGDDGVAAQVAEFHVDLNQDRSLRLELTDKAGHAILEPPLIVLRATQDTPPAIRVARPGADWSVHRVAEIDFSVEAEDDYGLRGVGWEYRVNGAAPITESLFTAVPGEPGVKAHTATKRMALEDMNLKVGDSIYYRFFAEDARASLAAAADGMPEGRSYSQPYFLAIRPFDGTFYKGGLTTGSGAVPPPTERQVIVATTRFVDEMNSLDDEKQSSLAEDIARTQREVRLETERLRGKLQGAGDIPNLPERLNHMDAAIGAMTEAEHLLGNVQPVEALPHENAALGHLMAALSDLPQYANWMQDGAPSPYPPDPETDLAQQRLDFEKDKYELFEPPKAEALDKALVEALEKVRALARRHKEFTETIRREKAEDEEAGAAGQGSGQGQGSSQEGNPEQAQNAEQQQSDAQAQSVPPGQRLEDMLKKAKESRRELERLRDAMDEVDSLDDETLNKLREALDRTAQELAKLDEALGKKDLARAEGANQRAVQELSDLQSAIEEARGANAEEGLRRLAAQIDRWIAEQKELRQATNAMSRMETPSQSGERSSLSEQQRQLGSQTAQTAQAMQSSGEGGGGQVSQEALREGLAEAAQWMEQAAESIEAARDSDADRGQEAIVHQLEAMREAVGESIERLNDGAESKLAEALDIVHKLKESLGPQESAEYKDRVYLPNVQTDPLPTEGPDAAKNPPKDLYRPDAQAPDIFRNPPHIIGTNLAEIQELVQEDPQLLKALEAIQGAMQGTASGPSGSFGDPGMIQTYREVRASLEDFEEMLMERLEIGEQVQRLQQAGPEDLPPKYRDMAAKYFEALSTGPRAAGGGAEGER